MTQIEIIGMAAPVWMGLVVGVTAWIVTLLDDKKAEAERAARLLTGNDNPVRTASAAE
jgi:hypothetical protein